jgi:hypothetical protein
MPRQVTIPQQSYTEDIMTIYETPGVGVRVYVGVLAEDGQSFDNAAYKPQEFLISGEMYTELNGPPTSWAPDKPDGTYRNQDLWHFIDILRNTNA